MSQEFFKSTLVSKYIKYLLEYTPIPLYPTIEHDQFMIKGCTYIYRDKVLKCTKSGIFCGLSEYVTDFDYLYVSNDLTVRDGKIKDYMTIKDLHDNELTSPLVVTEHEVRINKFKFAEYDLLSDFTFGEYEVGLTESFISNISFYDSLTHKMLGRYLRLLRNQYSLDLMSLYNCYNYEIVDTFTINNTNTPIVDDTNIKKKILLVPIRFNQEYTVAMDCNSPILIKAVVYRNGLLTDETNNYFISNMLSDKVINISNSQFNIPFKFRVDNRPNEKTSEDRARFLQQFENDLYMAIQVPNDNNSTLTVLEGNYINIGERKVTDIKVTLSENPKKINESLVTVPSLLTINDGKQHPFSDKLISYLLRNTIDEREYIDDNVANIEKKIGYNPVYQGMWDNTLRYILYNRYTSIENKDEIRKTDILGFVDEDIEDAVRKGYIKYVSE